MRFISIFLFALQLAPAQTGGFSGTWNLNPNKSEVRGMPDPPAAVLKVEESATVMKLSGMTEASGTSGKTVNYPLDGSSLKSGDWNVAAKWEGTALLVSTLVSGPQNYSIMERWKVDNGGSRLTINRTIVRATGEQEYVLLYDNANVAPPALTLREETIRPDSSRRDQVRRDSVGRASVGRDSVGRDSVSPDSTRRDESAWRKATPSEASAEAREYILEPGTRILLRLTNSVNTKNTTPGARIYLETAVPVYSQGKLVIPRGSYVMGTVTESQRAGKVKGRSALNLRFESLTLPNGVSRDFRSRPGSVDSKGNLDASEGRIKGEGNKGGDAKTTAQTAGAGAGIGGLIGAASGHAGMGAGIGAAAGAVGGLIGALSSRGPDVVLPSGTTMELVLDRELKFTTDELRQ